MTSENSSQSTVDAAGNLTNAPANIASREPSYGSTLPEIPDIGLTVLCTPQNLSEIVADICFIHGLGGHPRKTWQYGSGNPTKKGFLSVFQSRSRSTSWNREDEGSCYWPFDLLRRDFNNIRILAYGYDSSPSHWYNGKTTQMTIDQHTQTMLQKISNSRLSCRNRPTIFVAHNLGGILVKNMIILSAKYKLGNLPLRDVGRSRHAIFFFGTPHRGARSAELGMMLANVIAALPGGPSVYKNILRNLEPDSEKLVSITSDFNDIMEENVPASEKIQIYSFQEGKGYARITLFDHKVVPDGSSIFNRRAFEQSSHIDENHMDMCRFKSANDSGYSDFKAALTGYMEAIMEKIAAAAQAATDQAEEAQIASQRGS